MLTVALAFTAFSSTAYGQRAYTAYFNSDGIAGTITVNNGQFSLNIAVNDPNVAVPGGLAACFAGGAGYHVHDFWRHNDTNSRISAQCSSAFTGGHHDPWNGCGPATGNSFCAVRGGCINDPYSPNFPADPFSAEVGDWSSKFGFVPLVNNVFSSSGDSYYEYIPRDLRGLSVVVHCTDGARAFCAPFRVSNAAASGVIPNQVSSPSRVIASLNALSPESVISIATNGDLTVLLDGDDNDVIEDASCDNFAYGIFNPASSTSVLSGSALGSACSNYIGTQFDPTHQCLAWSDSPFCVGSQLCGVSTYSYSCDYAANRFSCAPGDLSGKFGMISDLDDDLYLRAVTGPDTLLPPTDQLLGKIVGVYCPGSTKQFVVCGTLTSSTDSTRQGLLELISLASRAGVSADEIRDLVEAVIDRREGASSGDDDSDSSDSS